MLRDYQLDAISRIRAAMRAGHHRVLVQSPTGSGKTEIMSNVASRTVETGRKALWLAHRSELVDQAAETLIRHGLTVGVIASGSALPPNPYAPIQVASVQTLLARNIRPPADMVFADEAHHFASAAETFCELLKSYSDAWVVGATATPERGDGCGLRDCFDTIVVGATVKELTANGYLVPCEVFRPDKPLAPGKIAQNPVDAYLQHARGRRAIVFCKSVQLSDQYASEFTMNGLRAMALSADTPLAERRMILDAFKRGGLDVIVNVFVLTEGFDDPGVSCCIIARGCGSAGMYLQMIGRVLRPAPGKTDAILIDLRGVSHEHGRPEADREFSLDGKGIRLRDPNSYCPVCGAPKVPGENCASCGYEPSGGDETGKPDKVTGDALKPWMRLRETDDDGTKVKRLARWIEASRAKGYKDGFWRNKYAAIYGARPSASMVDMAIADISARQNRVA